MTRECCEIFRGGVSLFTNKLQLEIIIEVRIMMMGNVLPRTFNISLKLATFLDALIIHRIQNLDKCMCYLER